VVDDGNHPGYCLFCLSIPIIPRQSRHRILSLEPNARKKQPPMNTDKH
jgi:hypothetical protein